ncbi:HNH endonuclease [Escherichia coli]|uniref:HNH endonuclease n=1 Tax=Escherichia coli TaxID=562 RepID=UPI002454A419|nr:HNH endonuclease [Escherichia coli]MDH4737905.1 HNH endonuclease [Escherichia coli]MDH4746872.1 HNH endonuclease [Escherichia coli]
MNNEKFNHIKRLWYLKEGVIFTRYGDKPVSFAAKKTTGHRYTGISINGKWHTVFLHEAVFILHHNRPIAEGKEIHHVDHNCENNVPENLIELTRKQHQRIHQYQCDKPLRGIRLRKGAWRFEWREDNGSRRSRTFHDINEAMAFRDEIERPRRQELRALGLNCKRAGNRQTASTLRQRNRQQNPRLWRHRQ